MLSIASDYFFSQRDLSWKDDLIRAPNGTAVGTIGNELLDIDGDGKADPIGCAMTDVAMVMKCYGEATNPKQFNAWLNSRGGYDYDGNIDWATATSYTAGRVSYMPSLSWTPSNWITDNDHWSDLKAQLDQGYPVIVKVDANLSTSTLEPHWVLVTAFNGGDMFTAANYSINDPWALDYEPTATLARYRDATYDNTFFATRVYHGSTVDTTPPTIGNFETDPVAVVTYGDTVTITGWDMSDIGMGLNRVEFWRADDAHKNIDEWTKLHTVDLSSYGNGPVSKSYVDQPPDPGRWWYGIHVIDNAENETKESDLGLGPLPVVANVWPSIDSLSASPDPVSQGSPLTLTANNVRDIDGVVVEVEFYLDVNGNRVIDVGTDQLWGTATSGDGDWSYVDSTSGLPLGTNVYMARAQDIYGAWSNTVTTTGTVEAAEQGVEVGSALFRGGVFGFGHAALYWLYDGYTDEDLVIQANGVNVTPGNWGDFLAGEAYWGSRELVGIQVSDSQRRELAYRASWQIYAPYTLTIYYAPNSGWKTGDGLFRCDTLVQYVYQEVLGSGFDGGDQTPHAMLNASNASPVTTIAPSVSDVDFSGQASGSITISFSELMSRGTLDPDWTDSISLVGSIHGPYTLSSSNVILQSDSIHGRSDVFAYLDATGHLYQSADRAIIHAQGGFVPGEELTLSISQNAKDLGGNPLQSSFVTTLNVLANEPPSIASLSDTPDPVTQGNNVTLTANTVTDSDGTVGKVEFYRDANGNGVIDVGTDALLGTDTSSDGGWTCVASTSGFPLGSNAYLARAQDDDSAWSNTVTTTGMVNPAANEPPSIASLSDTPDPVTQGNNVTLTANTVTDSDGTVGKVEFYRDANGNGVIDVGTDALLGTDTSSDGGWTCVASTSGFPLGSNAYLVPVDEFRKSYNQAV